MLELAHAIANRYLRSNAVWLLSDVYDNWYPMPIVSSFRILFSNFEIKVNFEHNCLNENYEMNNKRNSWSSNIVLW